MDDLPPLTVCRFWARTKPNAAARTALMAEHRPDLAAWLTGDRCLSSHTLDLEAVEWEYDTGLIEWEMSIVYDRPEDAVQHRLRW